MFQYSPFNAKKVISIVKFDYIAIYNNIIKFDKKCCTPNRSNLWRLPPRGNSMIQYVCCPFLTKVSNPDFNEFWFFDWNCLLGSITNFKSFWLRKISFVLSIWEKILNEELEKNKEVEFYVFWQKEVKWWLCTFVANICFKKLQFFLLRFSSKASCFCLQKWTNCEKNNDVQN